ncbi:hypothetical protein EMCRGX_G029728 [Ephydatia muelleri]
MALNSEGILLTVVLFTWASCQAACPSMKNARTYRINYNAPPNCEKTTCDYSVAIATNSEDSSFLDFVLEGNAQGWVAIGFSTNGNMPDADVLACALNPSSNNVEIIDTYNAGYTNIRDTKQDVCPHFSNYTNGRITCSFSRAIDTGDKQDKILNEPYHLMYGASNKSNSASSVVIALSRHNVTPGTSPDALNPAKDTMLAAAGDRPVGEIKMASTTDETDTVPPTPGATASSHAVTNPAIVEKDLITPTEIYTTLTVDDATSPSTYHRSEEIPTTSYVHTIPTTITPIIDHISEEHTTSTTDGPTKNPIDKVELTIPTTITSITNHISEEHTTSTTDGPTKNPIDKVELTIPTTITPITNHISEEHTTSTTDGPTKTPITEMGNTIPTTSSSTIGNIPGEYTASTAPESQMSGLEQNTTVSSITSHTSVKDPILETLTSSKPTSATTDVILTTLSSPTSEHSTATTFHPTNDEHTDPTTSNLSANPTLEIEHTFPTEMSSITSYTSTPKLTTEVISSTQLPGPTTDEMSLPIVPSTDMSITAHVPSIATQMGPTQATNTNMHSSTGCPSSITLGTNQHEFKKTFPSHCNRTTCDYYISIQTNAENPHFLDFVLEASAQGWVAIGFSSTPGMRDADVLACALHPNTKSVVILDTYNTPRGYNNVEDSIQNVCPYSTNFSDGRISCIFSRAINTVDPQDKDLSKDYYHLYGAVDDSPVIQDQVVQLSYHSHQTPTVSDETVNIIPMISISSTEATSVHGSITSLPSMTSSISSPHVTNCPPMPPAGAQYRLQITLAPNCAETRGCGYFMVGVRTNDYNSKYLDFVMEGDAQGWIAIGFSPEKAMPDADVLACALNPSSNNVEIIDTYNAGYTNIRDTKQDVCPHFSNYTNGRITCSFSRAIDTGDKQDKILNEPYHLMYGAVDAKPNTVKPNTLLQLKNHGRQVPMVTTSRVNPAFQHEDLNAEAYPIDSKRLLVLSHGILMLVAWPLVATVGIFFASWMKPALPKGAWFQVHRSFMTISLVVAACAFILIFIANKGGFRPGLIAFSTPLISVARCAPDAPRRWIFNITHGSLIGVGAYLLALVNVAIGIFLLEKDQHQILWVYVALVGFLFTLLLVLFVVFTVIAARSTEASKLGPPLLKPLFNKLKPSLQTKSSVAMVDVVSTPLPNLEAPVPQQAKPKDEKKASKDAPLRWTGFIILLAVMLPMVGVIGIKIALIDLL